MKRTKVSDPLVGAEGGEMISTAMGFSVSDEKLACDKRERNFQTLFDGVGEGEEEVGGDGDELCSQGGGSVGLGEKKRRLNIDQVKALEKNFEVENKLEPERKVKLALELGLQPRQVAVWFQNRRARWKTKQLERDYGVLKADYDALKLNHDNLQHEHDGLLAEIQELKAKLAGKSYGSTNDETFAFPPEEPPKEKKIEMMTQDVLIEENDGEDASLPALIYKDGSSDSDTSVIPNDDGGGAMSSSSGIMSRHHHQLKQQMMFVGFDCSSPSSTFDGRASGGGPSCGYHPRQGEVLDAEQTGFLHGGGGFFDDEQAPTFYWYSSDQWSSDVRLDI